MESGMSINKSIAMVRNRANSWITRDSEKAGHSDEAGYRQLFTTSLIGLAAGYRWVHAVD